MAKMGLLTDPNTGQGKVITFLINYQAKLCFLMYFGAIIWFCLLSHSSISLKTHFSENALLPGLVTSEFSNENLAKDYYEELMNEMTKYKDSIPYPWLLAKFRQIGLDTYSHNFTLNYPLGTPQKFKGRNVYAILRAARAASTESLVLSVPYRPPSSIHLTTAPSIALMLAFGKYANRERYWAKDIIFVVTEHEQLGIQAWLEAYHSTSCGGKGVLQHGDLQGRAGSIQAAINLELHSTQIGRMDVKIEGLNGHLPNLDLVTLVHQMCNKDGSHATFKNRANLHSNDMYRNWKHSFYTMLSMMSTQSTGVPNGNHGLFHRFGIEAVTLEGFPRTSGRGSQVGFHTLGQILESVFRSLNNLLERFHQSYFFYILPSTDRFISIGLYIPVLILFIATLFIKPLAQWYTIHVEQLEFEDNLIESGGSINLDTSDISFDYSKVGMLFLATHIIGVTIMKSPQFITQLGLRYDLTTDISIFYGFVVISLILLLLPFMLPSLNKNNLVLLNTLVCLELGTILVAVGMMNFSLGALCGVFYSPIVLLISPSTHKFRHTVQWLLWLIFHPLIVMIMVVFLYTYFMFPNEGLNEIFYRSFVASRQGLVFSIVDSIVYGNWLYNVATALFLPNWLCLWIVVSLPCKPCNIISIEKKTN